MATTRHITPFRFRELGNELLISNEVGDFAFSDPEFLQRFFSDDLLEHDNDLVDELGLVVDEEDQWKLLSLARRVNERYHPPERQINYLIFIPTLRCNLSCSYCQVSRAPVDQSGFDWTEDTLERLEVFLDSLKLDFVKVEFQGGEPTLRPDLLERTIEIVETKSNEAEFVICTNLVSIDDQAIQKVINRDNVTISTSIDGDVSVMAKNRTSDEESSSKVFENFTTIRDEYGPDKISALPTITNAQLDNPKAVIDQYIDLGFQSIFLRPVNYMGFARKQHRETSHDYERWLKFYFECLDLVLEANKSGYFEEYYAAILVRRIFAGEKTGFVDYRSPSRFLNNFLVIDFDETIYPSDESRMLSRVNHVDLSVGTLNQGIDEIKVRDINQNAENQTNPDCIHCAYQPFCGIDIVDDISRYNRFDIPKADTWFCIRHITLFDFIFEKVRTKDAPWLSVFARWVGRSSDFTSRLPLFE